MPILPLKKVSKETCLPNKLNFCLNFPRGIVEHPGGLGQTWDMPQYFLDKKGFLQYALSNHEHYSCSVFFLIVDTPTNDSEASPPQSVQKK